MNSKRLFRTLVVLAAAMSVAWPLSAQQQAGPSVHIDLTAQNIAFDKSTISVPAGALVVIEFTNNDDAPHNFAVYRSEQAQQRIFRGEIIEGPGKTVTYEFRAPEEPGTYFFRCDVHPNIMTGDFVVEGAKGQAEGQKSASGQRPAESEGQEGGTQPASGPTVRVDLRAQYLAFDKTTLTAPAGARVVIQFTNLDPVPHNVAIYRTEEPELVIFRGKPIVGPDKSVTYEFAAPEKPGSYLFRCDIHHQMQGTLTVGPSALARLKEEKAPTGQPATGQKQAGQSVRIELTARNIAFDKSTISVPARAHVVIEFTNQDDVQHNFAVYHNRRSEHTIFRGEIITGPGKTVTYEFTAPSDPATYFFRCDVHPNVMTGDFVVTPAKGQPGG